MTSLQKVIKYIAMSFGIGLALIIATTISLFFLTIFQLVTHIGGTPFSSIISSLPFHKTEATQYTEEYKDSLIKSIEIDNTFSDVHIISGESFSIVCENVHSSFRSRLTSNGSLKIQNNGLTIPTFNRESRIFITIPEDHTLQQVKISNGVGQMEIDSLTVGSFILKAGAGTISGTDISAGKVTIDVGIGKLRLHDIAFNNMDLNGGIGNVFLEGKLSGENTINSGIGTLKLSLKGNRSDYDFNIKKGLGRVRIDGESIAELRTVNEGSANIIDINRSIGSLQMNFQN